MKAKINNNQIKGETAYSYLVTLPHTQNKVWISKKLVYSHGWWSTVYLPDDMVFHAVRGKTIKFDMSASAVAEALESVEATNGKFGVEVEVHKPEFKKATDKGAIDELKR